MRRVSRGRNRSIGRILVLSLALVVLLSGVPGAASATPPISASSSAAAAKSEKHARPGEIIVAFRKGVSQEERQEVLSEAGAASKETFEELDADLAKVDPDETDDALEALKADPRVEYAEPNYYVHTMDSPRYPNDEQFDNIWGLDNQGQWVGDAAGTPDADIDAPEAWEITTGSRDIVVAVIDTGVDFVQPDLGGSHRFSPLMWINRGEDCPGCRIDGVDNDGNGYVDDWRGWDFANDDNNPNDDNGHGTHVAGTIGALGNNGIGGVGVNWDVSLVALKFLDESGGGSIADAVEAILYAGNMGFRITNNSWGSLFTSQALYDAIEQVGAQGTLVIAAAGNDTIDIDAVGSYPAAYDLPNIISVAATDSNDQLAWFSNTGQAAVDLGAPGTSIYSTWRTDLTGRYRYLNGTSMATAFVSGAAALASARFPDATALGLKALLLRTVDPVPALDGITASGGRLNVNNAVRCDGPQSWLEAPGAGFALTSGQAITLRLIAGQCGDTSPEGLSLSVTANGEAVELTHLGDGLYEGTFTATAIGEVEIAATATTPAGSDTTTATGRVLRDYHFQNVPFNWVDATAGGTRTGIVDDDGSETAALPFPFTFYDEAFSEVSISANGYIAFGSARADVFDNLPIPHRAFPNGFAAPFWDDLNPSAGGEIWYHTVGEAPNRRFVVSWIGLPHYTNVGDATFQVILHEGSNVVEFQYLDVEFGRRNYDYGASATVGIEQGTGTVGTQFAFEEKTLRRYAGQVGLTFTPLNPGDPTIDTMFLETAVVGEPYNQPLAASGGTPPYAWLVVEGELPPGLTLDPTTGVIGGTPTLPGTYAFTVLLTDSSDPQRSVRQQYSLLAVRGYAVEDVPFEWIDARDGGADVGIVEEDGFQRVELPFTFTFYDEQFTHIQVGSNGYITFGDHEAKKFSNVAIPDPSEPNGFAAPFWDDLSPQAGGGVWYRTLGEAPNRRFVVMWAETPHYKEIGAASFEIILDEGTNAITFQYLDASFEFSVYDYGDAATIGIENPAGTAGKQVSYNEPVLQAYEGTKGIRFTPLSVGARPPLITTLPQTTAIVNQPYVYQASAWSESPLTWQLLEAPPGMVIDPATGLVAWTPAELGVFDVTIEAASAEGTDVQEYQVTVQAGPTEVIVLDVAEGWDSQQGALLSQLQTLSTVTASDDQWLMVQPGQFVSLQFEASVPAGATIQSVRVIVEHHEEYGTPEGSIVWEVGGGTLTEPMPLGSLQPEIAVGQTGDKIVEWDVTEWVNTAEAVGGTIFVVRNNASEDQTLIDHVYLEVHYVAEQME